MPTPAPRSSVIWLTRTAMLLLAAVLLGGCAVQRHVDRGRAALDRDDPVTARYHLDQAVGLDPSLKRSKSFARDYDRARRDAAIVEGSEALDDGQALTAIDSFKQALKIDPDDALARQGLDQARGEAAGDRYTQALRKADVGDLAAAREALTQALSLDPNHADARAALDSLDLSAARQPEGYRAALAAAATGSWDEAVAGLARVVAQYPRFLPARAALPEVLNQAAEATEARAEAALAAGDLDEAEAAFEQIARYRSDHPAIAPGLARVYLARAQQYEQSDRPGAALLAYREVLERQPSPEAAEAVARMRSTVRQRYALAVSVQPDDGEDADGGAGMLVQRTVSQLQRSGSLSLRIAPDAPPVTLAVTTLDPGEPTATTQRRQHPYDVAFQVPNPDIDRLQRRADRLQSLIFDLNRRSYYAPTVTYGLGYGVGNSYGYGHRRGYGYNSGFRGFGGFHFDNHGYRGGYSGISYRSGYGHGYRGGYGSGFGLTYANTYRYHDNYRELRQARDEYQDTLRALDRAPDFVTLTRTEYHPFVLKLHERTGRIDAVATLPDGSRVTASDTYTATDTSVPEPRPDLGLAADPDTLAGDAEMRRTLTDRAGKALAAKLSRTLIQQRVAALQDEAATASNPAAATEARVAAAVLLEAIDPQVTEQLLDAAR